MKMRLLFLFVVAGALVASSVVDADMRSQFDQSTAADKSKRSFRETSTAGASSYRSPGSRRKVVIEADDGEAISEARAAGAMEVADYGSFKLFVFAHSELASARRALSIAATEKTASPDPSRLLVRDDYNALLLRSGVIDTTDENSPGAFFGLGRATRFYDKQIRTSKSGLRLVQFIGPAKSEWLDQLRASGMEIIAYVPNNGYLVRGTEQSRERLIRAARSSHARGQGFLQWEGDFAGSYKIHPALASLSDQHGADEVTIAVQIAASSRSAEPRLDVEKARSLASSIIVDAYQVQGFTNLKMRVNVERISAISALANVVNIEPWSPPRLTDERAAQIGAAALTDDGTQPRAAGYMQWLNARGFHSPFDFAIDVTDSGLDRGATTADKLHPDFLDSEGRSRVIYARDFTSEGDAGDPFGHGTINVSIAGGSNLAQTARDQDGYLHGLGVAPFVQLASSKIFLSSGRFDLFVPYSNLIFRGYESGARISSNSWAAITNEYTLDSQEYDARVRDASNQAGDQEMTIVFAAGNSGLPETIGSPGTAKNVITVGASENFRKQGTDGCNIKDIDADSALDVAFFSSRGPLFDGRMKPDLLAPGSHVTGAASQHPDYDGSGVCGEDFDKPYFPSGQMLYTWSSGTSHSTPAVAGAAALARQYFLDRSIEPNAALIKALLTSTTTYMNGALAGGDLPHPVQGWGLLDLDRAFDETPKIFINQTELLTVIGEEFVFTGEIKDASRPFRVTLAWSDAPGLSAFASWVNDLDLEVTVNGQVYRGNNFKRQVSEPDGEPDTRNNVEGVWLPAGTRGTFLVRVRLANLGGDAVPGNLIPADQDFALVVYNGEKRDVPVATFDSATVMGGTNGVPDPGETVSMKINLGNASTVALASGRGTLRAITPGVTVTTDGADFPQIVRGATGESLTPFVFSVASSVACGSELEFALDLAATQVRFTVRVGLLEHTGLFADDIEAGEAKWTHASGIKKKKNRVDTWEISTRRFRSGASAWFSADLAKTSDAHLDSIAIQIPANSRTVRLVFYHTFSFEPGQFDGGVLEISTGGDFEDAGEKIIEGGYNGKIRAGTSNPIANRAGWVDGRLGEFERVVVDLSSYAGRTIVIRFRIGSDSSLKGLGWHIDDVSLEGERPICTP